MGALAPAAPGVAAPVAVSSRATVAYLRALTGDGATPQRGPARLRTPRPATLPQVIAADRTARATTELRRARRAVSELVVALRAANAAGQSMEIIWLRRRLRIERLLFHAALAERRVWQTRETPPTPGPDRQA
jgi:hypothetical protein